MRMNFVMLAVLAGLGASGAGVAEAKNLSCMTGISPSEQRLLRDCEPTPQIEEEVVLVYEMPVPPPPPPPKAEPARMKHGESGKEKGSFGRDKPSGAGGGNGGGSHGGGGSAAHGNESAGGSSAN